MPRFVDYRSDRPGDHGFFILVATELLQYPSLLSSDLHSEAIKYVGSSQGTSDPLATLMLLVPHVSHITDMGIDVAVGFLHLSNESVEVIGDTEIIATPSGNNQENTTLRALLGELSNLG